MYTEFSFEYQPKYSDWVNSEFDLLIQCDAKMRAEDDPEISIRILRQEDDSVIELKDLDLRDQALINDQSYLESDKVIPEAYQKYLEAKLEHYNKEYFYE